MSSMVTSNRRRVRLAGAMRRCATLLLLAGGIGTLAGCTCGRKESSQRPAAQSGSVTRPGQAQQPGRKVAQEPLRRRRHYIEDKAIMRRINMYARDMHRRLKRNGNVQGPARVVANQARQLKTTYRIPRFMELHARLIEQAEELGRGTGGAGVFNGMVDTCIACHQIHSRGNVRRLEPLRVIPQQRPPGSGPGPAAAGRAR